jgi:hypothetical protein
LGDQKFITLILDKDEISPVSRNSKHFMLRNELKKHLNGFLSSGIVFSKGLFRKLIRSLPVYGTNFVIFSALLPFFIE